MNGSPGDHLDVTRTRGRGCFKCVYFPVKTHLRPDAITLIEADFS